MQSNALNLLDLPIYYFFILQKNGSVALVSS